ncbi:GFA family protein [Aurantimonas aggregata]|uniref:GFA family protein n=1 Tax=Aurantimonas aggregata TaxID=2047720 RepID=A0A6L9MFV0_9HYPH|nr:GFA family protein [Aurantimonas aggregata]NDV86665.1 GFA family protein [Aurantimonas aggregata]
MSFHTGGCQCGAVRFRVEGDLGKASICHCRMCQKAFGNFFAPLVSVPDGALVWTKVEPTRFRSSNHVTRGFCPSCGTPLTYEAPDGVGLAIGAFDDPAAILPTLQFGVEGKIAYVDRLHELPARRTEDDEEAQAFLRSIESCQHADAPDSDEQARA